jgi:copper chaperone CopZ
MNRSTLHSNEISCDGCVKAIKAELSAIEGVKSVAGDSTRQEVVVEYDPPATLDDLKTAMNDIGYPVDAVR